MSEIMNIKHNVLIVDDEEQIRKLLSSRFEREGWEVRTAENGQKALEVVKEFQPTIIVTDIKMPGLDGFQLIKALREDSVECPVIVITGHGEKECAIEAVRHGAFDYIEKPFDLDDLSATLKRAIEREELRCNNDRLYEELKEANKKLFEKLEIKTELLDHVLPKEESGQLLVGTSEHIKNLREMVRILAENFKGEHSPVVLVVGESGVGKEVVARFVHQKIFESTIKSDPKNEPPFVAINCAAFPDHLLESELFGYEKGAFTGAVSRKLGLFEIANHGTLFLDEIGEMDLKMQAKLLRVLQERVIRRVGGTVDISVSPHIVAATNRDLAKAVADKTFREDLYYRLNTIPISVAPLRSRPEDVEILAGHFLRQLGKVKKFTKISDRALKALLAYHWPGNVRELRSVIERAVILEKGPVLELTHLRQEHMQAISRGSSSVSVESTAGSQEQGNVNNIISMSSYSSSQSNATTSSGVNFSEILSKGLTLLRKEMDERFVRDVLVQSLTKESGNVSAVARQLRLDRANLLRMLKRYEIHPEVFREKKAS